MLPLLRWGLRLLRSRPTIVVKGKIGIECLCLSGRRCVGSSRTRGTGGLVVGGSVVCGLLSKALTLASRSRGLSKALWWWLLLLLLSKGLIGQLISLVVGLLLLLQSQVRLSILLVWIRSKPAHSRFCFSRGKKTESKSKRGGE